jgi:hypothetical protein
LAKVTGPNQFSLAVSHWTTAKVDDWLWFSSKKNILIPNVAEKNILILRKA